MGTNPPGRPFSNGHENDERAQPLGAAPSRRFGAKAPGPGALDDRLDGRFDEFVVDGDLEADLVQEVDLGERAAVGLGGACFSVAPVRGDSKS